MANRHLSRTIAMQTLYEWDFLGLQEKNPKDLVKRNLKEFAPEFKDNGFTDRLVDGVIKSRKEIDELIKKFAPEWPIDQITVIDRNILRLGIYELKIAPDIPPKVAINESIELAKTFGGESSGKFVNGVLGTIYRKMVEEGVEKIPQEICGGGVVVRKTNEGPKVLLILDPYDKWTFPKGHNEPSEILEDTALREVKEETGVEAKISDKIGIAEYTIEKKNKNESPQVIQKIVHYYLMKTDQEHLIIETKKEAIKDGAWFSFSEALKRFGYENTKHILEKAIGKYQNN